MNQPSFHFPKSPRAKAIAFGLIFLLTCIAIYLYSHSSAVSKVKGTAQNVSVTAYTVTRQDMKRKISLSGQTVPVAQVDISTKYAGKIADVAVNLGDVVAPGQVLLIQDTVDTNLTLNQDKAALEQAVADSKAAESQFGSDLQKAEVEYDTAKMNYNRYAVLKNEGAISQQELELQNARAALVLSQIQPHFLFNSMAVVMDLCDTNPQEAKAALQELSDYLHFKMTAMSSSYLVSFDEDIEFVQNYLKLEKRRFGDRLTVEYDIQATNFRIPLLTLQPLVENAVRHGISKRPEGGTIRITTRELEDSYSILLEDNGVGFDTTKAPDDSWEHVGLSNVRTRLIALCRGSLTVHSVPGEGTTVEIRIKKEELPSASLGRR